MGAVLYQRAVPVKMGAYPYWVNPFRWHGVVETENFFQTVPVDSMVPEVDAQGEARTYFKPEETPVTQAAKASYFGQSVSGLGGVSADADGEVGRPVQGLPGAV